MLKTIALAALPLFAAGTAHAAASSGTVEVEFRYAQSDLRSDEEIASLRQRVRTFARQECDSGSVYPVFAEFKCRRGIETQLIRKIGDQRLARAARVSLELAVR